jgi:hypothetical protein
MQIHQKIMDGLHVSPLVSPLKMLLKLFSFIEYGHMEREGWGRGGSENKCCPLFT